MTELDTVLKKVYKDFGKAEIWLLGDLNINLLDTNNNETIALETAMGQKGLLGKVLGITRPKDDSGTCIDLIYTNCHCVSSSGVMIELISDHFPVYACRKKEGTITQELSFKGRSYKKYKSEELQDHLACIDWSDFYTVEDPNLKWALLKAAFFFLFFL